MVIFCIYEDDMIITRDDHVEIKYIKSILKYKVSLENLDCESTY